MTSATPSMAQDVSSLRAAALLTLKSRAKPQSRPSTDAETQSHLQDDTSSIASTRRAAPSPGLYYGSDDGLADAEGSTEEDEEMAGEKEEGEISDDETATKHTPTMMDVDNEPLPGLTSSLDRPKAPETVVIPNSTRGHKSVYLPSSPMLNLTSTNPSMTTSFRLPSATSLKPPTILPLSSMNPRLEPGTRAPELPAVSRAYTPSDSTKPAVPIMATHPPTPRAISPTRPHHVPTRDTYVPPSGAEKTTAAVSLSAVPPLRESPPLSSRSLVGHTHARPSLHMTTQEFLEAKTIILDLLGWGVPPEYFINCGLTREAIYYAFSEMNLKLPANLNTDGIIPYGPQHKPTITPCVLEARPTFHQSHLSRQGPSVIAQVIREIPNPPPNENDDGQVSPTDQPAHGQAKFGPTSSRPLPPRPKCIQSPPSSPSTYGGLKNQPLTQQSTSKINSHSNSASNRLLAGRTPTSPVESPGPALQGHMLPRVLQTSSTPSKPQSGSTHSALPIQSSLSSPKSDTPLHGYSGNLDEIETLRRQELLARKAVLASRKPKVSKVHSSGLITRPPASRSKSPPPFSSSTSNEQVFIPPETVDDFLKSITSGTTSGSTSGSTFHPSITDSPDSMDVDTDVRPRDSNPSAYAETIPTMGQRSQPSTFRQNTRNSTKRPVASDFVDYDTRPSMRESPFASSMAHNGNPDNRTQSTSTSAPSFSNLAPSWKVVIDFSDTEDEGGLGDSNGPDFAPHPLGAITSTSVISTTPTFANVSTSEVKTPPIPSTVTLVTPAALLAKEQEIKRMKELIAQRELDRLKKLINGPKGETPPSSQPTPCTPRPISPLTLSTDLVGSEIIQPPPAVKLEEAVPVPSVSQSGLKGDISVTFPSGDIPSDDTITHDLSMRDVSTTDISTTSTPPSTGTAAGDVESAITGEQVLTAEAGQEQVASVVPVLQR